MTAGRRRTILDAAEALFLDRGYGVVTIADIRAASGASTGSIYHAFGSKQGIALALARRALAGWAEAVGAAQQGESAEQLIRATVAGLLTWGSAHPGAFALLDRFRSIDDCGEDGTRSLGAFLDEQRQQSSDALAALAASGQIRPIPAAAGQALILGPAYEYLRACQAMPAPLVVDEAIMLFADAAWKSVAPA